MLKFLIVLTLAVVAIKAYDFSDVDYNQFLFDEFEFLNEDVALSRQRRDAEVTPTGDKKECGGKWKKDFACCVGDKLDMEHVKQMKEVKKQCAMKLRANNSDVENFDPFDCEKMSRIKQLIICEGECFARAINVLDESGKLNREAIIKRFADHMVVESDWKKAAYEGYVDKCLAQVEAKQQEVKEPQCSTAPMEFHHCIWGEFINGCPADLRIDSHKCNRMRERHAQGTAYFLNKHLLHGFLHHSHRGQSSEQNEK
ncbi:hypothetical protein FF38_09276 [Lucilia cuprina]|uniref:Uncharacterized protein n=1 Tax=Lucilia cuprina TaxID=7375 RepID=A0A0L0CHI0_LUCCU|nr:uncharacterized protein LOC111687521 [Lucilia cuprina]KAI8117334.1 hypothetical protein CVS40_10743 [Lucilia cuprina]KNC30929.1 hypothetical protein FF38_09276 [Lucilia cuprina]